MFAQFIKPVSTKNLLSTEKYCLAETGYQPSYIRFALLRLVPHSNCFLLNSPRFVCRKDGFSGGPKLTNKNILFSLTAYKDQKSNIR